MLNAKENCHCEDSKACLRRKFPLKFKNEASIIDDGAVFGQCLTTMNTTNYIELPHEIRFEFGKATKTLFKKLRVRSQVGSTPPNSGAILKNKLEGKFQKLANCFAKCPTLLSFCFRETKKEDKAIGMTIEFWKNLDTKHLNYVRGRLTNIQKRLNIDGVDSDGVIRDIAVRIICLIGSIKSLKTCLRDIKKY